MVIKLRLTFLNLLLTLLFTNISFAETPAEQLEFFEARIRPVLVRECYECHNTAETQEGNLSLDHKAVVLKGGDSGALLIPGKPEQSLLLKILRHEVEDLEMPEGGQKLSEAVIADFEKWIAMGAPDPREHPPSEADLAQSTSWEAIREKRAKWWSFQPLEAVAVPDVKENSWSKHPIDQFILEKLNEANLPLSDRADKRTLIRRLSFTLTGLPPSEDEIQRMLSDESEKTFESLVDHYLSSDRYGEHWARHWMDLVRYAETHGSEGDPTIPFAWRYRDYLIRALNRDVPYDRLVKEHIAGDLLRTPRINEDLGINESKIGPAHWRMCFHGFAPTDALDEKVRFIDDQINVFSKAFMGLTVSCARCHNHKFDPISQADYYALFGILGSTHPAIIDANTVARQHEHHVQLSSLRDKPLAALADEFANALKKMGEFDRPLEGVSDLFRYLDLSNNKDAKTWTTIGNGVGIAPDPAIAIQSNGIQVLPPGTYSHLLSSKHRAVVCSPRITLTGEQELWVLVAGDGDAMLRYVVHDYPRNGTVYPIRRLKGGKWHWEKFDLSYWDGEEIHVELSTAPDQPVLSVNNERSWFGVRHVIIAEKGTWKPPTNIVQTQTIPIEQLSAEIQKQVKDYQALEEQVHTPTRVPGLIEAKPVDQRLMIRGDHKQLGEPVPRRFLEVIDPTPYGPDKMARWELASDLFREDNPLTARVIVNRLWHYLYGQGLVRTVDNFGRLGEVPSHAELLDYLAVKMRDEGWSIKQMIRFMVTSNTWQQQSTPSAAAISSDPDNRLLSHASVRRLEAESIRDQLLVLSGRLTNEMYGPPMNGTGHNRRSVYSSVRRNSLDPFLAVFDAPVPFATQGRRSATNVPAQSLTMLNDPFVQSVATGFANRAETKTIAEKDRIVWYLKTALGREPTLSEEQSATDFLKTVSAQREQVRQDLVKLKKAQADQQTQIANILGPIRKQLEKELTNNPSPENVPTPFAFWSFDNNFKDEIGDLDGKLHGNARIEDGALLLDGKSFVSTPPLPIDVQSRTLQVLVQLDSLNQRGGGAMTIQTTDGHTFDAIVFGEQEPQHWLAGSNNFHRTESFQGIAENEAVTQPVQVTVVYEEDCTIRCYRNGKPYGKPYRKSDRMTFLKGKTQLLFGLRHGTGASGNRMLSGKILEASFFNRALTSEEVAATTGQTFVSNDMVRKQLSPEQQQQIADLEKKIKQTQAKIESIGNSSNNTDRWTDLTQAILNLKEVIYLR